jgi:HlyD family secretion protein
MARRVPGVLIVSLFVVGWSIASIIASHNRARRTVDQSVRVEVVRRESFTEQVTLPGYTVASSERSLNSDIVGRVKRIYVHRGDQVEAGELLLDLDTIPMTFSVEEHVASLAKSRALLKQASALLRERRDQFQRSEQIAAVNPGAWSEAMRDSSIDILSQAIADSLSAEAKVESCVVEVQNDHWNIARAHIRAPSRGTVEQVGTAVGQLAFPQSPSDQPRPLITLLGTTSVRFQGWATEEHVARLHGGDSASISIRALDGRVFSGIVAEIGYSAQSFGKGGDLERAYKVLIDFVGEKPPSFFGQTASAEVTTASMRNVLTVSTSAVVGEPEGNFDTARAPIRRTQTHANPVDIREGVFVVKDQRVQFRRVRFGSSSATRVVVLQGVSSGDRVVVGPFKTLRVLQNGDAVR